MKGQQIHECQVVNLPGITLTFAHAHIRLHHSVSLQVATGYDSGPTDGTPVVAGGTAVGVATAHTGIYKQPEAQGINHRAIPDSETPSVRDSGPNPNLVPKAGSLRQAQGRQDALCPRPVRVALATHNGCTIRVQTL